MLPIAGHRYGFCEEPSPEGRLQPKKEPEISAFSRICAGIFAFAALLFGAQASLAERASAAPCDPPANPIVCENSKTGDPQSEWDVDGAGDPSIQGFATEISVDQGETVDFKIDTDSTKYHLDIYRMGYYAGAGARKVDTVEPSASLPQDQDPCETEPSTGLIDCGNWGVSASWQVPADAVSGIYFAKLQRTDQPSEGSHIVFVVRDDDGGSDLLFQTADTTWQAYNQYGGNSLYVGGPGTNPGRAYKVSYNRPLTTRGTGPEDAPFNAEYPMVRWLERNGYDVSYFSGVDAARRGGEMLEHKAYLSVGHDEYWSGEQRANVEAARDADVNLAFFSGNEIFWKTRWEDSIDGSGTDYRTLVSYKETHANEKIDPEANVWTGTWRDPRFSATTDGGKPENALSGTIFQVNSTTAAIEVPAADGRMRLWRGTNIASLGAKETATLADGTLGYEWDAELDNGFRPPGLVDLSSTTVDVSQQLLDYGSNYGLGTVTHHLTLYRAESGALVFGAGTIQWSWGLDGEHDRGSSTPDSRMQQATVNLLADMEVQPGSLQGDLLTATQTTDSSPPTTTISSPTDGSDVESGETIVIKGIATDVDGETAGGQVGGVEVSTDGGQTWHPAEGRDQWTYSWTPGPIGDAEIIARAVDDSGNLEEDTSQVDVNVVEATCPCSIWGDSLTAPQDSDSSSVEVGVRFRSDSAGLITGIRFYKTAGNTGPHVGYLWTSSGGQLAEAAFTGESPSGWQVVNFDQPVPIHPGTTYVASYHAPHGHYASLSDYFSLVGADNPPLHALADEVAGDNGIYKYGPPGALFSDGGPESFQASNYLVDVVFDDQVSSDVTPPLINSRAPAAGATSASVKASVSATFSEGMDPTTISGSTFTLRDPSSASVPAAISYSAATRQVKLDPASPLSYSTTYTVTAKGGLAGIKDLSGNPLAADSTWSFTTGAEPPPFPDDGPGGPILVISNAGNPFSRYYAEILRAEGMNEFAVKDVSTVTAPILSSYDVAILGEVQLSPGQTSMLASWVGQGGNLIAMRPDAQLAGLLGLSSAGGTLANGYLKVDTGTKAGAGVVGETIQFHGSADRYTAAGAQTIATLYSGPATSTPNPAVTLRSVGTNGGQAAAFSYDLAKSIVYTRQGNPAWNGEERDGQPPVRSDDLFFGAKAGDVQPDWVNLDKVAIPQADEQQRLLTNMIGRMNMDRKPLPRFWFLPRDEKAAIVMTGDDHGNGGTVARFDQYEDESPSGCVVTDWQCVRSTSYIYPNTPISDAQASAFTAAGFELALHAVTNCVDWNERSELEDFYSSQLEALAGTLPSLPAPVTNRTHCIAWGDWATQPKVELENGIRLDTNYYYWPQAWAQDRPGMFTGSGMPMRFADLDGSMIDVYQAATQMTDESGQSYPLTPDTLLDNALGSLGYYGVFTANMHTDDAESAGSDAIVASALERDVPVVSAKQMLSWLDGRNQSSFGSIAWAGDKLTFTINPGPGANGLRAMIPVTSPTGKLVSVERGDTPVAITARTIKGTEYAFFDGAAGSYTASYAFQLTNIVPSSPANQNSPKIHGIAPDGSTVRIYTSSDCSGSPLATADADQLAAGVTVSVPDNTTTEFHATVTPESGAASGCSVALIYIEDSSPPEVAIDSGPSGATQATTPSFGFHVEPGALVECSIDTGTPDYGPCTATTSHSPEAPLDDGSYTFRIRATDAAGNQASASRGFSVDTTGPTAAIDKGPDALTASATAVFEFSGADAGSGIASFQCRLDAGDWELCDSPQEYASLADGAHSFAVRAIDVAGNTGSPGSVDWTVDATAPTASIDKGPAALTASASAAFEFSGADAGSGIASYQCRLDSGDWESCHSPRQYTSLTDGAHGFQVRAIDQAGNIGPLSNAEWTVDTTAPTVAIDEAPATLVASASANFEFSATDPGGSGIASFQCRLDSGDWELCDSPQEYASLPDGDNSFAVRAIDVAGNVGSPVNADWTIDTTAPTTTIDKAPAALTTSASAVFEFSATDPGGSGISSFQCRLDSADWESCDSPKVYASLADGAHGFAVRAIDVAGNVGSPASAEWTVDTTAPTANIDKAPPALTSSPIAVFEFSGVDAGSGIASFQCRKDAGDWEPCHSPQEYASLADGAHGFQVRAIDQAGNIGSLANSEWTVDTTAPTAVIDKAPATLVASATAVFEFSGIDDGGSGVASYQCRLDSADWGSCASPKSYDSLSDGSHSFGVRAIDVAGNVGSPASAEWTIDATAPTATIDKAPTSLVASATAVFEFSGADGGGSGVASFQCRRDAGAWGSCDSPQEYASLSDGDHSFQVRATDVAGNVSSPVSSDWTVDTTAPTATIDKAPAVLVASASANFEFSGADGGGSGVASFQCRKDAGDWELCDSPQEYSSLADGDHSFAMRAIDVAGNVGSPTSTEWTVDTTAPTVTIDKAPASLVASATANFEFSGSDTGSGIASLQCRLDSADWESCHSPQGYASLSDGAHSFAVRTIDIAGNVGSPASTEWTIDTTAPAVSIDKAPAPLIAFASANFEFSGSDTGSGIASFQCRRDAGDWESCDSPKTYSALGDGAHSFAVRATDVAGNVGSQVGTEWTVDTTDPTVQIDKGPDGLTASATAVFEFSGADGEGSGIASFQCRLNSGDWEHCESLREYTSLTDGNHSVAVRAIDVAGNVGSPASANWTIDTAAPITTIDKAPAALTASASASLEFSAADPGGSGVASFQCRKDAGDWELCESPKTYTSLADGDHSFAARAIDVAGNVGSPASAEWTVDTTAPTATIDKAPASLAASTAAVFEFSGADGGGSGVASFQCRRDSGDWESCDSPIEYTSLADGAHSFQVRAIDVAGNVGSPVSAEWAVDTTTPTVTIDKGPSGPTNDATPSFEFHSSEPGSDFECSIDAGTPDYVPCSGPGAHTPDNPLADGPYSFRVRAIDVAGNEGTATQAFSVDTAAPPTPGLSATVPASPANENSPEIFGSASAGSTVRLYAGADCSGTLIAAVSAAGLAAGITVSVADDSTTAFRATATSEVGNFSACSAPLNYVEDSSSPSVTIDKAPASLVASATAVFEFSGTDGGGSGVASFQCRRDAGDWGLCHSPQEYTSLADGDHSVAVRAIDVAGNVGSPVDADWTIDTVAPTASIDKAPMALTASASASFEFSAADPGGSGVTSFQCRRDAGVWEPCESPKSYTSLADGAHSFAVRATDIAGNVSSPASTGWTVDTTAPAASISKAPAALVTSASAVFEFSGADGEGSGVASFQCRKDSGDWELCESPKTYTSLADGDHSFAARAIDVAGNVGSPGSAEWTIDTTAPAVTITKAPPALTSSATANFEFSGSDAGSGIASFQCRLDSGDWESCHSPRQYTSLTDGPHSFAVRAIDVAGNTGSPVSADWTVDTAAPPAPELSATVPASPANENSPKVVGSAVPGSTVRLYAGADCSDAPIATVSAAELAAGITASVADDSTTAFRATATSGIGNLSACSAPLNYVEDSSAPSVTIGKAPAALVASATANFEFSGSDGGGSGVLSFQCRRDFGDWESCHSPQEYTSLTDGAHSFQVRAVDQAGNVGSLANAGWTIDATAPTTTIDKAPASLTASASASFEFSGADGGGAGVTSYQCRLDSGDWELCDSPKAYTSLADGDHSFQVRTIDQAGNVASPAHAGWTIDTTAPTVSIDKAPAALTRFATAVFEFSGVDAGSGVASFECRLDSADWESCDSPKTYNALGDGAHSLAVRSSDIAGNVGSPASTEWTVDTTAPTVTIDKAPAGLVSLATANFEFSGDDGGSGVASFQCRLDSGDWELCDSPQEYTSLTDDTHSFAVRAIDVAGNVGSPAGAEWTVDTTAPTVAIDSGPSGLTNDATPSFEFHANEPGSDFECSIDAGIPDYGPCSGPGSHTLGSPLADGPYSFRVRAIDAAGNEGEAATQTFSVDTAAPPAPELSATTPASPANENSPRIFGSTPAGSTVRLYAGADCSGTPIATVSAPELAAGITVSVADDSTNAFRATATSGVGNLSACSALLTYVEDSSAPSVEIDGRPADPTRQDTAIFVFSGTDIGSGIASFQCRLDTADWETCSTPTSYSTLADGNHDFEVRAIDHAGNTDASPASFSWRVDTIQPQTEIDSGPSALAISVSAEFTFSGSDSGSGVTSFECRRDTENWGACSSPTSLAALADGSHSFEVRAIDEAGNTDASPAIHNWSVDTAAPPAPDLSTTVPASPANENSPEIFGSAPAGSTVRLYAGADCSGTLIATVSAAELAAGVTVQVLDDSVTQFSATATSATANPSLCSAPITYSEDSGAPSTEINAGPATASTAASATFEFSGSDTGGAGIASFECRLDAGQAGEWGICSSPKAYAALPDGSHSFEVRAIDLAGNVDASPATYGWDIDTATPTNPSTSSTDSTRPTLSPGPLRLLRIKLNRRQGIALLVLDVPGPGRLSVGPAKASPSKGLRKQRATRHREAAQVQPSRARTIEAGEFELPVKFTAPVRKLLLENRRTKIRLKIVFEADGEPPVSQAVTITLKKRQGLRTK